MGKVCSSKTTPANHPIICASIKIENWLIVSFTFDLCFCSFHYGVSEEDSSTFYLFLGAFTPDNFPYRTGLLIQLVSFLLLQIHTAWETLAAHKALIGTPGYPQDTGLIAAMDLSKPTTMNHIEFNHDVLPAFNAPVTEILSVTLQEGKTKDDLDSILEAVAAKINSLNNPKYGQVAWGQSLEAPEKFYLVIGWDSVKVNTHFLSRLVVSHTLASNELSLPYIGASGHYERSSFRSNLCGPPGHCDCLNVPCETQRIEIVIWLKVYISYYHRCVCTTPYPRINCAVITQHEEFRTFSVCVFSNSDNRSLQRS